MRKIDLKDVYLLFFGLVIGLAAAEVVTDYIPKVVIFGLTVGTGVASLVVFLLLTLMVILLEKAYYRIVSKIAEDVRKNLEQ
ncbi:hypothetical protein [Priestia koreensis]|uniref:Uncharacterized protein n=1 Tax=Priestia koreensis TaxID=284581 RepID=A0A0M0KZB9_9BACI|nr:hypothetical protein [Priestia koreensis]KOO43758.1 hypothetical protein AMD01_15490 [Priestia koreensis]